MGVQDQVLTLPVLPENATDEIRDIHNSIDCFIYLLERPDLENRGSILSRLKEDLEEFYQLTSKLPKAISHSDLSDTDSHLSKVLADLEWEDTDVRPPLLKRKRRPTSHPA